MKRAISFFLVLVMVMTLLPMGAFAAVGAMTFTVGNASAEPGSTVSVDVTVENNPGVISANLAFTFDEGLTLIAAKAGDAFAALPLTPPAKLERGEPMTGVARFMWQDTDISASEIKDGVILTLTFEVDEDAVVNKDYIIEAECIECCDRNTDIVYAETVNGYVSIIDYTPGDVTGDKSVTTKDVIWISRFIVDGCTTDPEGYNVVMKEIAADVTADGNISTKDVIWISRYIVDGCMTDPEGYNVKLFPGLVICEHEMTATPAKAATCEEDGNIAYWYCSVCSKYFTDAAGKGRIELGDTVIAALGHDVVVDKGYPAEVGKPGLTDGSHCDRCGQILVEPEIIDPLKPNEYGITYRMTYVKETVNGMTEIHTDNYLRQHEITNSNDSSYVEGVGIPELKDAEIAGYNFLGWFEKPELGAVRVYSVPADSKGDKVLYGVWQKVTYTATLNDSINGDTRLSFTVDEGTTLGRNPEWAGYSFVGWSNGEGEIVRSIPVGTAENVTLTANWVSERNKAWAKKDIGAPIIIEDEDSGTILFTYEIGRIENVPLITIENFGFINSEGVTRTATVKESIEIDASLTEQYARNIANETTNSSQWSLSSGWSDSVSVNESWMKENNLTEEDVNILCKTDSDNWQVGSGKSGSSTTTKYASSQDYDLNTSTGNTKTFDTSTGTKSNTLSAELDVKITQSAEANVGVAKASGSVEVGGNIGRELSDSTATKSGTESDSGNSKQTGSVKHTGTDKSSTSGWSTSESYGGSSSVSATESLSRIISERLSSETGYGKSYINTGDETNTQGFSSSSSSSDSYSSAVTYSTKTIKTNEETYTTSNAKTGFHRLTMAGTAHVFAVVGYDIKTASYFVTTYTIMDDELHFFEDYSRTTALYDDHQTGVIPFEIPYEVEEYVLEKIGETDGLEFNNAGVVTGYSGSEALVIIPEYHAVNNLDGTKRVMKVTGISANAFAHNTDITGIELSDFITEIPDNAFEGCSSLWLVDMPGVTGIGREAFKGCPMLDNVFVSKQVTSLGENAFENTDTFAVCTDSFAVIEGAAGSGAKNIAVYLAGSCEGAEKQRLSVPAGTEVFVLNGRGYSLNELPICSDAITTVINNVTLNSTKGVPLTVSSPDVRLGQVVINAAGFAMALTNESCELGLYGESSVSSASGYALLCRSISLAKTEEAVKNGVYSELMTAGDVYICGSISGSDYLNCTGEIRPIDETLYAKYLRGLYNVRFDAGEGAASFAEMTVLYGTAFGELPTAERTGYTFDGWFTESGVQITEDSTVELSEDITLYARWTVNAYTVTWADVTGIDIAVERCASPNANAAPGQLGKDAAVYYGDVLKVTYTAQSGYSVVSTGMTDITVTKNITAEEICASTDLNSFIATWSEPANGKITVNRTASPQANAATGTIKSGSTVYYGDVLSISYSANTGYSVSGKGKTSITVTGSVTSGDIYANVSANNYTYNIVYKSSHGVSLGSTTVTKAFGTTNTISAPAKAGYATPGSQSVKWDSTSAKTITFTYTPNGVSASQCVSAGNWTSPGHDTHVTYSATAEYRNRTANSIEVRIVWVNTIAAKHYYGYTQYFEVGYAGGGKTKYTICTASQWKSTSSSARSVTCYSDWVTVSVPATATTLDINLGYDDANIAWQSFTRTMSIPTY